jgi:hypothetical protein
MGRFVNPDSSAFQVALNSRIYVDKTGLQIAFSIQRMPISAIAGRAGSESLMQQTCWRHITARVRIPSRCFQD